MLDFTDWAKDILRRSHEAAKRLNPDASVRLSLDGAGTARFDLVDAPRDGDEIVAGDGFMLYVAPGISGVVDVVEPHDQLVLRPSVGD